MIVARRYRLLALFFFAAFEQPLLTLHLSLSCVSHINTGCCRGDLMTGGSMQSRLSLARGDLIVLSLSHDRVVCDCSAAKALVKKKKFDKMSFYYMRLA